MSLDWKNENDYDYTEQLDANGWGFEFLRRNPDYLADWEKVCNLEAELTAELGPREENRDAWWEDERVRAHVPPIEEGESENQWMLRTSRAGQEPRRVEYLDPYKEKYYLKSEFPDPISSASPEFDADPLGGFPLLPDYEEVAQFFSNDSEEEHWGLWEHLPQTPVIVFDLSKPLEKQLDAAKTILKELVAELSDGESSKEPKLKKIANYSTLLRTYLRVWDAHLSGAGSKEIGEVIFPNMDAASKSIDAATKKADKTLGQIMPYVFKKYRNIPFLI